MLLTVWRHRPDSYYCLSGSPHNCFSTTSAKVNTVFFFLRQVYCENSFNLTDQGNLGSRVPQTLL